MDKSVQPDPLTLNNISNYLQQQTMNNQGRHYMLSFTYARNKYLNPMGNRRQDDGDDMRMLIRN